MNETKKGQVGTIIIYLIISVIGCIQTVNEHNFISYFTNLSNYFALGVMIMNLIYVIKGKAETRNSMLLNYCATMALIVTGLVYNTLLKTPFEEGYWSNYHSLIMHVICPTLLVVHYFLYGLGKNLRKSDVWYCVCAPYAYLLYILCRSLIIKDGWYPYFFLNYAKQGASGIAMWVTILTVVFVGIGFLVYALAHKKK